MQYIKHATKKISDNIQQGIATLAHTDRLQDEALAAHKQNLDRLAELVASTKKNCTTFASAVTSMSGVGITMSSEIGQFYKSSDSMARSTFVGRFSDTAMRVDSIAIDIFRERFGWEVLKRFDDWEEKIRKVDRQIQATEKNRVQVQNLSAQVSSLKGAKERRQQQGKELNEKEQQQYDEAELKLEKYGRTLAKNRRQLDVDVNELMNDRFRELDSLLAKVVECQLEFFKSVSATQSDSLSAPLASFKREFCSSDTSAAAAPATTAKASPPSSDSEADDKESDSEDEPPLAAKPIEKKQMSNGDLFHPPSPAAAPKVVVSAPSPLKRQGTADDLLDIFGAGGGGGTKSGGSSDSSKPSSATTKSSLDTKPHDDLFNMFDSDALSTPSSTKKPPASPTASTTRSVSPAPRSPASSAAKPPSSFDHFDPFGTTAPPQTAKPTSRSVSPSTNKAASKPISSSFQAPSSSADPFGSLADHAASSALEDYHEQEKNRASDLAARDQARPKVDGKLTAWEFKSGTTKNNLRTLLATLHTVLPEGNRWKKLSLTDLLDFAQMKKGYRNAMLATHPDKWQNAPAEHKVIVQRCFEVLNDSWQAYEKEQGH